MKAKITQKLINSLEPREKHYRVYDTEQPGLFIRVQPTGHKSYMVTWDRNRERSLGQVGTLTLAQARTDAARYLADAYEHGEPLAVTQGRRGSAAPTLRDFLCYTYHPWFKAHYKGHEANQQSLEHKFSALLDHRLSEIEQRDLARMFHKNGSLLKV